MAAAAKKVGRVGKAKVTKPAARVVGKRATAGALQPRLRIRMYRHGLGDCMLLRFRRDDGESTFNVLIDCGLITVSQEPTKKMTNVAKDIADVCGNRLDLVVMTHEHWDHASGFAQAQARAVFDSMDIGEVWYAWTEDPQNELGKRLRKERADKVKALESAAAALRAQPGNPLAMERGERIQNLLGFFGCDLLAATGGIGRTREAFDYLRNRTGVKTRFCSPDKAPMTLPGVSKLRIYVLGPPQDEGYIKRSSPTKKGREVYEFASESNLAANLENAFQRLSGRVDPARPAVGYDDCPFDPSLRRRDPLQTHHGSRDLDSLIREAWDQPQDEWRRIDDDWTQAAETLALNLDSHTNNTCLVLAFELVDTGEVFLFPADAQVGNWLSWQDCKWRVQGDQGIQDVTGPDLLARTVFYKVGHHGSHNATLRALGLEQMVNEDLVAFIPVNRMEAAKNRWHGMPFGPLLSRLLEKTSGRLLQSDQPMPDAQALVRLPARTRKSFLAAVQQTDLWFEYSVESGVG